jgi:hypothetical protein
MKHPHKLIFIDRKTWKCTECSFFVHKGLTHILAGKEAKCWDCGDMFIIDTIALREDKPRCFDCRQMNIIESIPDPIQSIEPIKSNEIQPNEEMLAKRRKLYKEMGWKIDF